MTDRTCKPTDYSNAENWFMNDFCVNGKADTEVDVFFFSGTSVMKHDQENGVGYICEQMTQAFQALYEGGMSAFDDGTRMYIPYYRQIASDSAIEGKSHEALLDRMKSSEVAADIEESLDYYFRHYNQGRPFIIAGQSQGGAAVQIALEKYFSRDDKKQYIDRLVAAYSIAYGVDRKWLKNVGCIDFAEGATDTGVLISWNTEGPGATEENFTIQPETVLINPINWKRDETTAYVSENKGSRVNNLEALALSGKPFSMDDVKDEIYEPGIADARIDLKRGALICTTVTNFVDQAGFGDKSLHTGDWDLYYRNISENMQKRIETFMGR